MKKLLISGELLTWENLAPLLKEPMVVRLTPDSRKTLKLSHRRFIKILAGDRKIYGVTTGFGKLSQISISKNDRRLLQLNLVRSHAAGVGRPLSLGITRVVMVLKILTFIKGYSGVRPELVQLMLDLLKHDILPLMPRKGSVGASGDLAPLAHLGLALIGEGLVHYQNREMPSMLALKEAGLKPLELEEKEGLSLVNGTQVSSALAIRALAESKNILNTADISGALSTEASLSSRAVFRSDIHALKLHPGQQQTAENVWNLLDDSKIVSSHHDCERIQDPYSIRCIPHVHGTGRDIFSAVEKIINNEINSISDNPLILKNGEIVNSGHFHGEPIAQAMDCLAISMAEIGAISERRIHYFMKGIEPDIPPFAALNPGLESGLMMVHVTATALASENKTLTHPASVDSISSSAGQEDFVSMAPWAGRKCHKVAKNVITILAVELLVGTSVNLRFHKTLKPGIGIRPVINLIKRHLNFSRGDHEYSRDLKIIFDLIYSGKIVNSVKKIINWE
ncbi:MAG: histidine ammonia-lyase [Candidatus Neomarinimicrobiota bacterium]